MTRGNVAGFARPNQPAVGRDCIAAVARNGSTRVIQPSAMLSFARPGALIPMRQQLVSRTLLALALATPLLFALLPLSAQNGRVDPALYAGLRWRSIGPFRSGRVNG